MRKTVIFVITSVIMIAGCTTTVPDRDGVPVKVKCQPIYGNWCGKGYPAYKVTGYVPTPVDVWDRACMIHDFCYDEYGDTGREICDIQFSRRLEGLDLQGIPAPHQMINAYNYFKRNKPFRHFTVTLEDLFAAITLPCQGGEGLPTLFCDVGLGRNNCEISTGLEGEGLPCFCNIPPNPSGIYPGVYYGIQKSADRF